MSIKQVRERVAKPFASSNVDREKGVIHNVLICGFESANGREYPRKVFERDYRLYEGRPVNANHGTAGGESTIERRLGWFENVKPDDQGRPRGDFHMLKSHPMCGPVMEAAERNPSLFGFSHVAMCELNQRNGIEVVEAIKSVVSVDLVADPATTKGLHESKGNSMRTIKTFLESWGTRFDLSTLAKARRLVEMDDMAEVPMEDAESLDASDASAEPDDAIDAAFGQAMHSVIDGYLSGDLEFAAMLSKLKELGKAHGKVAGDDDSDSDSDDDSGSGSDSDSASDDSASEESHKRMGRAIYESLTLCESLGFVPNAAHLKMISSVPKAERKGVAEELKRLTGSSGNGPEQPSGHFRQKRAAESKTSESKGTTALAWQD